MKTRFHTHVLSLLALITLLISVNIASASPLSGKVLLVKGIVSATSAAGENRLLAKGQAVGKGDRITTTAKSFIVIKMEDNTKITLRPDSAIVIGEFEDEAGKESATLELVKGGLRTVTGLIGDKKPEAFKLKTGVATIGIRGTDFIARLCGGDCIEEERTFEDLEYIDVEEPTLSPRINEELPFGLYFLVKEGRIYVEQCPPGETVTADTSCPTIELPAGKAGYAGGQQTLGTTTKVPLFLENDPYIKFSDMSESTLDALDVLQDEFSDNQQCEVSDV